MRIFKLTGKNSWFVLLVSVFSLLVASPLFAVEETSESFSVQTGDTFVVKRPIDSSFHSWELDDYDVRKLSLIRKRPADTIGHYRFVFRTLSEGQVSLSFTKLLNTSLGSEELVNHTATVTIREEQPPRPESPEPEPEPTDDVEPEPTPAPEPVRPRQSHDAPSGVDSEAWSQANDQIETGNYEEARELIDEQIAETAGRVRQEWMNLKAESYLDQENYAEAIGVWESMIDEFEQGPRAKWFNSIAEAQMKNDQPDQAQLSYMEIRHRFPDSTYWPEAMRELADIAVENDEIERARRLLERTRSRVNASEHPGLLLDLGEIYDRYPSIRDYPKAVRYYERAANVFDSSDTRARTANDRARYLKENFLQFGTE